MLVTNTSSLISSPTDAVLSGGRRESTPRGGCRGTWLLGEDGAPGGAGAGLMGAAPNIPLPMPVSGNSRFSPQASSVPAQDACSSTNGSSRARTYEGRMVGVKLGATHTRAGV